MTDGEPLVAASHNLVRDTKYRYPVNIQLIREISQSRGISLKNEVYLQGIGRSPLSIRDYYYKTLLLRQLVYDFIIRGIG